MLSFSAKYRVLNFTQATGTNNFSIVLVKPNATTYTLIASTPFTAVMGSPSTVSNLTIPLTEMTQTGSYIIRITGQLQVGTGSPNIKVLFDNVNLIKTPAVGHVGGDKCNLCHDLHGQVGNSMDAMVRSKIGGLTVAGFTDRTQRTSYFANSATLATGQYGICQVCHASGSTVNHFNRTTEENSTHQAASGKYCIECHDHQNDPVGFKNSAADNCNGCHGNPPYAGDIWNSSAQMIGAHAAHTRVASHLPAEEDKYDCGVCHVNAENFDLSHSATSIEVSIGYTPANGTCTGACHKSSVSDGFWTDSNGLDCNSCHYWGNPTNATDNTNALTRALSPSHSKHFDKTKPCTACHADNSGDLGSKPLGRVHIDNHEAWDLNLTNDGDVLADRGAATQDEATVLAATLGTGSDPDPGNPTCAGAGVALGCHNTKLTPAWTTTVTCTNCHDVTGSATADPKSGLHNMTQANVQKHDSNITGGCTACHNTAKSPTHTDGNWQADQASNTESRFLNRSGLVYSDAGGPNMGSCWDNGASGVGSLDSNVTCHRDNGVWKRLWTSEADSTATTPGQPRCKVCHGQYHQSQQQSGRRLERRDQP